ncbi:phosphoglucose isomerase-like protein [Antricoccus suffuscus]|uniref:Phosphoglucose isomerase-like protein n=1 Tax=Antricoccus suffuscus TaxID=1629062 RepID=A0A2T0ZQK0_9ACTN|nr:SIS domain-containing protein [Antricoccus suffuscus]PRZ38595.1 phosphoglucose isomerase-like protein [Antricoccus suffuscus]
MTWAGSAGLGPDDLGPDSLIDDTDGLVERDRAGQLMDTAYAGSVVRRTATALRESGRLAMVLPPVRYFVVFAGYGAKDAAKAVAALAGETIAAPALVRQTLDDRTPWLGIADMVLVLSDTGSDDSSIRAAKVALQRGSTLVVSTVAGSPLDVLCAGDRNALVLPLAEPGNTIWGHIATGLAVSERLRDSGRSDQSDELATLSDLADALDGASELVGPRSPADRNPAKALALECLDATPLALSDSPLAAAAAYRFAARMLATMGIPVAHVGLPAGLSRMRAALEGPYVRAADDIFFDPYDDSGGGRPSRPLRVVLFSESGDVGPRTAITDMAAARGVGLSTIAAEGETPAARLASMLQIGDVATAYLPLVDKSTISKSNPTEGDAE